MFHDSHHIFIYMMGDIAFVPVEVLLVTLILHNILTYREKKAKMQKMNMVIGVFFCELGNRLLKFFAEHDSNLESLNNHLIPNGKWEEVHFKAALKNIENHSFDADIKENSLDELRTFLLGKREFLLGLLGNPNLLEHDRFTDTLWAVFHLAEEFAHRKSVLNLPEKDYAHIKLDMNRAYSSMVAEWIEYNRHLKTSYPYLFSLSVRTNPFDPLANVEVS